MRPFASFAPFALLTATGMLSASLYIITCTARNRLRVRLRRLREPRYLFGAIVGVVYFYFTFLARMRGTRMSGEGRRGGRRITPDVALTVVGGTVTDLVGVGFLVLAALVWVLPMTGGLLDFSEAEVQFLFTAPVSRRSLIIHRLMRSQLGLLFAALISAVAFPSAAMAGRIRLAIAVWLMLVVMRVYSTGVALSRAKLTTADAGARKLARAPLLVVGGALAVVVSAVVRQWRAAPVNDVMAAFDLIHRAFAGGLPRVLLWPFAAIAKPLFVPLYGPFVAAIASVLGILAGLTLWVLASDEAFQVAADEDTRRRAEKLTRERRPVRLRAVGWTLALRGRTEHVFLWKNALQLLRATSGIMLIRYFVPLTVIAATISTLFLRASDARGAAVLLCSVAGAIGMFTVILGPQMLRLDLRDDLQHLDLLKTWPVRAASVIRGEMLFPGVVLTGTAWLALGCAGILSAAGFPHLPLGVRVSGAATAFILAPALVFAQLTVHHAAAVLFPAWVPIGNQRPRGLDQVGQRLILLAAILLTLVVMLLPGVIVGAVLWFAFYRFVGAAIFVVGALICLGIVAIEVLAATEALGPAYEQMDILAVERAE